MAAAQEESKSASHPPYSEMVLTAITELGEKEGSSKLAISKQIELTYGDRLQENHPFVLSQTLLNLKESGKLLFIRNNYLKPDSNDQPRRSRGRPPKPKTDLPAKKKDISSASSGKKRGRPPKNLKINGDSDPAVAVAAPPGLKRGRGWPPKERLLPAEVSVE